MSTGTNNGLRRFYAIYQFVVPALLFPLAYWLWWERFGQSHDVTLLVMFVPVVSYYIFVAVGILKRVGTRTEGEEVTAIVHHRVTEVYYVLEGSGILVTGGDESDALEFPADNSSVLILIGPSGRRTVVNGQEQTVKPGDIVVIPAGVPHGFRHIQDQVTYLSVRVDPDQTLPTGYAHPSIAD